MITWKDEYTVGVELIDSQHKRLLEIANNVYELTKNSFITDKYDRIVEVIEELRDYTVFHFKSEEEYMLSIGYKKFLSHKVEHDDFVNKVNSLDLSQIDESQQKHLLEILEFIIKWIDEHILQKDKLITA
ncbi:hemerythrin family protein [Clostridium sp. YIM B02505]|uniref:Hemerythrin family protein n=1 Tax=Clostridium yunnanense TaxID=2800325 RepID=A0ABS1EW83_9CLOT|nr:bacteriohemerythrin [Clostridium yunnanense]MBK1813610.1 hemerythrin family protein [Clostridium yunnanense]